MSRIETLSALVLCGGASRRMGHSKALLRIGDRTFAESVAAAAAESCQWVVVVASPGQQLPDLGQGVRVVHDRVSCRGPIFAIASGLAAIPPDSSHVFVTGTDAPSLQPGLIKGLFHLAQGHDVAIATDGQRRQPLLAVYDKTFLRRKISELLPRGLRKAQLLADEARVFEAGPETLRRFDPELRSLRNVNDPAAYAALLKEYGLPLPAWLDSGFFET